MILKEGAGLAAAGLASGLFIAYQAARAMQTLLAGVTPGDALTFSAGIVFVTVMALVGSLFPALRATRTDPIAAIRAD